MDEATSSLDEKTENEIINSINLIRGKKTIIISDSTIGDRRKIFSLINKGYNIKFIENCNIDIPNLDIPCETMSTPCCRLPTPKSKWENRNLKIDKNKYYDYKFNYPINDNNSEILNRLE